MCVYNVIQCIFIMGVKKYAKENVQLNVYNALIIKIVLNVNLIIF
jgi:hypothetical protein